MVSKVAVVEIEENSIQTFEEAVRLVGGIADLNKPDRRVVVKVGVFDPKSHHHTTVGVVDAIVEGFNKAPKVYLAESDNYRGAALDRLQIWKSLFSERVAPFDLSRDTDSRQVNIAGEKVSLSHILFKPNVLVSTHVLRIYENGSVIKNLLGLTPDQKKARFHNLGLEKVLLDLYEAVGGIDLAVLDGTHMPLGVTPHSAAVDANILVVGRDAVAVEAVGADLVGMKPEEIPAIREAGNRRLGEGNLDKIQILGTPYEDAKERITSLIKAAKKKHKQSPKKASAKKHKKKIS